MADDDYGLTWFLFAFSLGLFGVAIVHLLFSDIIFTLIMFGVMFLVSLLFGICLSEPYVSIKSWRVVITTVDDGVYYVGRGLSFAGAKVLRDVTVKDFESKDVMLSVNCTSSSGRYGARNFVKSNIVHIGWLEDE